MAKQKANAEGMDVQFINASAESIGLDDNFFDTVIITYTMCTIPNLNQALSEIKRVMKTDGRLVFCEHGTSPEPQVYKWQNRLNQESQPVDKAKVIMNKNNDKINSEVFFVKIILLLSGLHTGCRLTSFLVIGVDSPVIKSKTYISDLSLEIGAASLSPVEFNA